MTKFPAGGNGFPPTGSLHSRHKRYWLFDVEPYSRVQPITLEDVDDDRRLKEVLKRTVEKTVAPQSLIDSIRDAIGR